MTKDIEPMMREEVIRAVERRNPSRIPMINAKWWGQELVDLHGEKMKELNRYPEDVVWLLGGNPVDPNKMDLPWEWQTSGAIDSICVIDDWAKLDDFIERLPDPENDPRFEALAETAAKAKADDRYTIFGWWQLFFEKPWGLRGMENLMCDYYTEPDKIHKLYSAMRDTYCAYIEMAAKTLNPDGFFTSDDLGHQTGPMMSPNTFHEFLFPYYKCVGDTLKQSKMHFWLHSCGDNTLLLPDLIEAGLTVFHPVQKHTMDEVNVANEFGDRLTFLAGIDVQHTLQEKDPEGIREEVRFLIDTFDRQGGGMCIGAGNGILVGTPFENIKAYLDEAIVYGRKHRLR
jgi:uroporphyrinogen decarboxylase